MTREPVTSESFGRTVLGPIVAEFCLRLWSLGTLMDRRDDVALLFCARGGLRIELAYQRFLASAALPSPVHTAPLMVSRLVATRPALLRTVDEERDDLLPSVAATLAYEFPGASVAAVAGALSGVDVPRASAWDAPFTAPALVALLRHVDGRPVVAVLREQATLFARHLHQVLGTRRRAVLVDTGRYGTTRQLLADGLPAVDFGSALIAHTYRPGGAQAKTFGLSMQAGEYSPLLPRTALLRYWHFVEWLFEPELPSVRTFAEVDGMPRSNLETDGWQEQVEPEPGSAFAGVVAHLEALPAAPADRVVRDADEAWGRFRRAVIWPDRSSGDALGVGTRSHDFGSDATWTARPWAGPIAVLSGSSMWREGEIARSGSPLRRPLLAAIETAYAARGITRAVTRRRSRP